jgi:RNA polymerase sigma-70 factor (ECF subfamily)
VDAATERTRHPPADLTVEATPEPPRSVDLVESTGSDPDSQSTPMADLEGAFEAALLGEDAGFSRIYRAVTPGLLRYLRTYVGDQAEDIASETWSQVSRDLRKFRGDYGQFRGWVTTIGRNRAIDHLRAQSRRPSTPMEPDRLHYLAGASDTAAEADNSMSTGRAIALISSLPADQAEALMLRVVMGLDAKTAGRVLGKRPGTVRTLSHRGLKALAARLESSRS